MKPLTVRYHQQGSILYLEALSLAVAISRHFPPTGGWVTLSHLASVASSCFPTTLSPLARVRVIRRCLELADLIQRGFEDVPELIVLNVATGELLCRTHPLAIAIGESIIVSPRQGGDKVPQGQ